MPGLDLGHPSSSTAKWGRGTRRSMVEGAGGSHSDRARAPSVGFAATAPVKEGETAREGQCEIASNARLFTAGPIAIDAITTSMLPAMNANTPIEPKSRRKKAMMNALNTTEIRLNE